MSNVTAVRRKSVKEAKTDRGQEVILAVCQAARKLLEERFYDQVPIVEVAQEAGVARASLLLQFPRGWPDILGVLAAEEVNLDDAFENTQKAKGLTRAQRLFTMLQTLFDRSEASGMLYPSIRSATFNFRVENRFMYRIGYEGCLELVVYLLVGRMPHAAGADIEPRVITLADGLLTLALDLASGGDPWELTWAERRVALRTHVDATVAAATPRKVARPRR
jgi:hypothetical protein